MIGQTPGLFELLFSNGLLRNVEILSFKHRRAHFKILFCFRKDGKRVQEEMNLHGLVLLRKAARMQDVMDHTVFQ